VVATAEATGLGVAVGTPAYMAPEQAAADPATDHRADLYALGLIAYEALAGAHPFAGRAPHAMLAAHLTEAPAPLARQRADVPPQVAALVARLLAKPPEERPQSADEVVRILDGVAAPSGATVGRSAAPGRGAWFSRRALAWAAAAVLAVAAVAWWLPRPVTRAVDERLVVVAPFRVGGADPALGYLREGMLDLLAAKLTGEGGPRSVNPRTVMSAWRRRASDDDLAQEQALALAQALGAGRLVLGEVVGAPGRLVLSATLLAVPGGRVLARESVSGPSDSLPFKVDELAARLLAQQAGEVERLTALTSTSLPALRAYLDGQAVFRRGQFRVAIGHYERALQLDSTFALAALGLSEAASWGLPGGVHERALRLVTRARARLSPRDQAYVEVIAGPRYPAPTSMAQYIAAAERFVQVAPDRPGGWSYLGDYLMHWGRFAAMRARSTAPRPRSGARSRSTPRTSRRSATACCSRPTVATRPRSGASAPCSWRPTPPARPRTWCAGDVRSCSATRQPSHTSGSGSPAPARPCRSSASPGSARWRSTTASGSTTPRGPSPPPGARPSGRSSSWSPHGWPGTWRSSAAGRPRRCG
jgi:serine/threonine-protein kinase